MVERCGVCEVKAGARRSLWSYEFVMDRTSDGKAFRMLTILDERSWEFLYVWAECKLSSQDMLDELYRLFLLLGIPQYIRSNNGPEFTARVVRQWLADLGVMPLFIEPGSPWENGYIESRDFRYAAVSAVADRSLEEGIQSDNIYKAFLCQ